MPTTPALNETIYVPFAADLAVQCRNRDGTPGKFLQNDILTAELWQAGGGSALMSLAIAWNVGGAGLAPAQTGYDQGQVLVRVTNAQSAALSVGTTYLGHCYRVLAADPNRSEVIGNFTLTAKGRG